MRYLKAAEIEAEFPGADEAIRRHDAGVRLEGFAFEDSGVLHAFVGAPMRYLTWHPLVRIWMTTKPTPAAGGREPSV